MKTITIELPDDTALPFGDSDEQFARELRLAAAIFWYDRGMISQGKGAEIAGLSRADFLDALFRAKVRCMPGHHRRAEGGARIVATPVRRIVNASPLILSRQSLDNSTCSALEYPKSSSPTPCFSRFRARGPADRGLSGDSTGGVVEGRPHAVDAGTSTGLESRCRRELPCLPSP